MTKQWSTHDINHLQQTKQQQQPHRTYLTNKPKPQVTINGYNKRNKENNKHNDNKFDFGMELTTKQWRLKTM